MLFSGQFGDTRFSIAFFTRSLFNDHLTNNLVQSSYLITVSLHHSVVIHYITYVYASTCCYSTKYNTGTF